MDRETPVPENRISPIAPTAFLVTNYDCPRDFPILEELAADGVTDYLSLRVPFSDGQSYSCSWATRDPNEFSDAQVARIIQTMPAF